MSENEQHDLGEGLVYRALLPFEWHPLDENIGKGMLQAQSEARIDANEHRLRTIAILNEYPAEISDELHHLEFKMNLLLELMGEVLATQLQLPPKSFVQLGSASLEWQDDCGVMPEMSQPVVLDVYLHPQYPKPVSLSGKVALLENRDGGQCRCLVHFDEFPESLRDQLVKLIFTHHRRAVAHSRRQDA
jgi:hypothetical protein